MELYLFKFVQCCAIYKNQFIYVAKNAIQIKTLI